MLFLPISIKPIYIAGAVPREADHPSLEKDHPNPVAAQAVAASPDPGLVARGHQVDS